MLFLLRPPQTRLPLALPRDPKGQEEWNRLAMQSYSSTQRVERTRPGAPAEGDLVSSLRDLGALRDSGSLTDEEFARAKAQLLEAGDLRQT